MTDDFNFENVQLSNFEYINFLKQEYLLDQSEFIKITTKLLRKNALKDGYKNYDILSFDYQKRYLHLWSNGIIITKKISLKNPFYRQMKEQLLNHKKRILRLSPKILTEYIITNLFDNNPIINVKLDRIDDEQGLLHFSNNDRKMFVFVASFNGMYEEDIVKLGYNYNLLITRIEIRGSQYIAHCKRKHGEVIKYEYSKAKKYFLGVLNQKNKEIAQRFENNFWLDRVNCNSKELRFILKDNTYNYLLGAFIRFLKGKYFKNFQIKVDNYGKKNNKKKS